MKQIIYFSTSIFKNVLNLPSKHKTPQKVLNQFEIFEKWDYPKNFQYTGIQEARKEFLK